MTHFLKDYIKKHAFREPLCLNGIAKDLGIIVVIPAHDEGSLIPTLQSLANCKRTKKKIEVIIVFNASETSPESIIEKNKHAKREVEQWFLNQEVNQLAFQLQIIEENKLPKKHAGVGLARKIGMDEAVRHFDTIDNNRGIIVCFDADSQCEPNYLVEIEKHFEKNTGALSIRFEHPIDGNDYSKEIYQGIYFYELHLRYYKNGLHFANLPYAYHTIGSSMAVDALNYCKQGGMNRRKAGEDFYFLQKFIDVGLISELNSTKVIPSPRASHRVPFGTGRAIQEMLDNEREIEKSYAFDCFQLLKDCFLEVGEWYTKEPQWNTKFEEFYGTIFLTKKLSEIRQQSTSQQGFIKRFFQWFNAFQCLKFIHFLRDNYYENKPLEVESKKLMERLNHNELNEDLLGSYRKLDYKT